MIPTPDPLIATLLIFGLTFVLFALGLPITFCLGGTAAIFAILFFPSNQWYQLVASMYGATTNQILIAIPLFIFMGSVMAYTGMAADLYSAIYKWAGPVRGALAMGTEVIGALFGAMCGDSAATTLSMGNISMPEMLKRGYHKELAVGTIATSGLLGILIPPTIEGIIYCAVTGLSVGVLYFALFIPGFLLAFLYIVYISVRCYIQRDYAPALPQTERATWKEKFASLRAVILPVIIILAVLGGIYSGSITPTEAAGTGSFLCLIAAVIRKGMTFVRIKNAVLGAFKLSSMVIWIIMAITAFTNVYHALGASKIVSDVAISVSHSLSGFAVIILMQVSIFVLGMIMDDLAVIMVVGPIYAPIVIALGFDPVWFGVLFMINMQCAWLTPPYGFNLFLMRAISPKWITTTDIYRAVVPFIGVQLVDLLLVLFIPALALYLPSLVSGR
jgi:tripartite ATP-independent transporter DctM subunit